MVASPVLRTGLAFLLLMVSGACYAYRPVVGEPLAPGDPVRLRLSAVAAEEFTARVGSPVRSVEGPLLRETPDSLRVAVRWGAYYAGTVFEGRYDTLQFNRNQILEIDRRELSRVRTGGLVAALVGGLVWIFQSIDLGGQGGDGPPTDPTLIINPGR